MTSLPDLRDEDGDPPTTPLMDVARRLSVDHEAIGAEEFDEYSDDPARMAAALDELDRWRDYYGRALVRYLHYRRGLTWAETAAALGLGHRTKQAAQQFWRRLVSGERRTIGNASRGGGRRPGQRAS